MIKGLKENKILKNLVCIILAYISSLAFSEILRLGKDGAAIYNMLNTGYEWLILLILGIGIFVIKRFWCIEDRRIQIISMCTGIFLSLISVWGTYILFLNDIFISFEETCKQIFLMLGLNIIVTPVIAEIFLLFQKFSDWYEDKKEKESYSRKNNLCYFLVVWGIIFLCYLPVFLGYWPGNFIYDASYQLKEVITNIYKTHHPLIHTWLMGKAYRIGLGWGDVSKGFQLYTLLQMLVLSSSFAYCILYLRKNGTPKLFRIISLVWFSLFPMNSIFSITATKDVMFAAFFLYTLIFFITCFYDKEKIRWYTYVALICFGVLSALFRNNAIYAFVVFGIIASIIIKGWKEKGKVVLIVFSIYLLTILSNNFLQYALNAQPGFKNRESLSVPLQGLARVIDYRGDELYEYEYNEICMYIQPETISQYNPFNSDPIKNNANEELLENNKLNFFKMWAKIGTKFPDEYLESFVSNTMGYWYLFPMNDYITMRLALYHTLIGTGQEIEKEVYSEWANKLYWDSFVLEEYKFNPILGYSFKVAPYIWFMFFVMLWSIIRKNKNALLLMLLPFLYFGTCLLGPLVAIRYVYCLIVCCPLWFRLIGEKNSSD